MATYEVHRSDANAADIIAALRQVGASVEIIDRPVDLLAGFRGRNYLLEVKTARGKLRASQSAFVTAWKGQSAVVRSVSEALVAIGARVNR